MSGPGDVVIDVQGLTKRFGGQVAVHDLTIQVRRGLIYGFLGPNGSGKTTTLRMLTGLLRPDAGRGTCLGYDIVRDTEAIKRHVGYMTQRFSLYADLTIRENLEFVARIHTLPHPRRKAREAIERLGLGERADQLAGHLSGGWKQRLALGACILPGPDLLLLDEPTAGVDPQARRDFWDEIHALAADGLTALVSTHYMDEAERCHELAFISSGELLTTGPVRGDRREGGPQHLDRHGPRPRRPRPPAQGQRGRRQRRPLRQRPPCQRPRPGAARDGDRAVARGRPANLEGERPDARGHLHRPRQPAAGGTSPCLGESAARSCAPTPSSSRSSCSSGASARPSA